MGAIVLQWHTRVANITDIPLMYFCGVISLTGKSFNKLSADDQAVVKAVFGRAFKLIDERNRMDNVKAFEALTNQGVETVVLTEAERDAWLAMQAPGEQMMQSEGQLSTEALERIKGLVERFASRNDAPRKAQSAHQPAGGQPAGRIGRESFTAASPKSFT